MKADLKGKLRASLLQEAIAGRLVPQDPKDEPACDLLKKIRAKKEKLIKEGKLPKDKNETVIFRGDDKKFYEQKGRTVTCINEQLPFEIPDSWEWCRLESVVQINPKNKSPDDALSAFIPMEKMEATYGSQYTYDEVKWGSIKSGYTHFADGDVAFAKITPCFQNRKSAVFKNLPNGIGAGTTELKVLRPCGETIDRWYLLYFLKSAYFVEEATFKGTANQQRIVKGYLENKLFPIPPLAEQKRIVAKIEELMPLVDEYEKAQEEFDNLNAGLKGKLRASLLQEAIAGRLVPQDPKDEPAGELLKCIRAEKVRLVKEGKLKKDKNETVIFRGDDKKFYEHKGKTVTCIDDQIPFEIPNSWVWCRMGNIGDWGAGATPYKGEPKYYGGDILWLRTGELNNGVVYDTEIKITEKALKKCSLRMNKIGDVLIAMYGATIGKLAIAGKEMTTNQACCGCAPLGIYNYYLFYFLMASKADLVGKGEGGAQPNISKKKLVNHLIPIPPLAEQKRIVAKIEELFAVLDNLDACGD